MNDRDDEIQEMRSEIQRLAAIVEQMQHERAALEDARQFVLLAKKNTAKQWTEQVISGGAIVDMAAGGNPRAATSDTAPAAIIDPGESLVLLESQDQTGMRYVKIAGGCTTASPETLGDGTEGLEAADTASWPSDPNAIAPLSLWVVTRVGYFEAGTETLYAYVRQLSFNSCGKLYGVTAETRLSVDVPELC